MTVAAIAGKAWRATQWAALRADLNIVGVSLEQADRVCPLSTSIARSA